MPNENPDSAAFNKTEIEQLQSSVDVIAERYPVVDREKLKNNLQYPGILERYREIERLFSASDPKQYYLMLLENLMNDIKDFPD